ncbi:unnamed protein product [Dicrocoelium dendriticum]|nr:unnamed protein product [Dicrocoelium dendriticum]
MNHPFGTLLDSARSEIKLLLHLLRAQAAISNLRYLDSSLLLTRASSFLRLLTKTHGAKAQSTTKPGTLISWYNYFHATLLAKFTLYWFSVLRQASGRDAELLEVAGTEDPCLMMRLIQFKDSTNALSVSLFSDTAPYGQGHGYVLPRTSGSTLTGGESSPFLFTIPQESALSATDVHIIQTLINDSVNVSERDGWNLLLHSFEEKVNRTYVVQKLETSVFLAIVYNGYRARKDRRILTFLQSLSHVVQLQSVATFLRPH